MQITAEDLKKSRLVLGMNQTEFADFLGINRSFYSRIERGAPISETTAAKIKKILDTKPAVDADMNNLWQEGFRPRHKERTAKAGRITTSNTMLQIRQLLATAIDQVQEGHYEIFTVDGVSMHPTLFPGDKLLCRLIKLEDFIDNRIYVIITNRPDMKEYRPDGVWAKRCAYRKENGYLNCRSDNKDTSEPFVTFRLKTNEIEEIWFPVLRITGNMSDPHRDLYEKIDELEGRIEMLESLNE